MFTMNTYGIMLVNILRKTGWQLMIGAVIAIHVARYGNVFVCSYLSNIMRIKQRITCTFQIVMGLAGMRGSIAYILSLKCSQDLKQGGGNVIVFVTIWIALFTVVYIGCYFLVIY